MEVRYGTGARATPEHVEAYGASVVVPAPAWARTAIVRSFCHDVARGEYSREAQVPVSAAAATEPGDIDCFATPGSYIPRAPGGWATLAYVVDGAGLHVTCTPSGAGVTWSHEIEFRRA